MSATTTTPTVHGSPARALSDVAVITRRNLLRTLRLPEVLVLSASMPVIFIVMFTYVFGGAIQGALPPGRTVAGQVALALAWAAAIIAVFAPLAVRAYRRTVS